MPIALDIQGLDGADTPGTDAEPLFRRITPAEFDALVGSGADVTLLDLREPADVAAYPIEGAVNAPLDPLARVLKTVPTSRRVVVYCTEGWWSEEVAEILAERGYDVASLEGGFRAYREYVERRGSAARAS